MDWTSTYLNFVATAYGLSGITLVVLVIAVLYRRKILKSALAKLSTLNDT